METEYLQFHVQRTHIPWFSSKFCKTLLGWSPLALREKYWAHLSLPRGALTICPVHFPKALCSAGSALFIPARNEQRLEGTAISQVNFTPHYMQRRAASFHILTDLMYLFAVFNTSVKDNWDHYWTISEHWSWTIVLPITGTAKSCY